MLPFCGNTLSYCAVILQILLYCKYPNATMGTRMSKEKKCVLPADGGAKVWSQCTKRLIDACQPGMYQPDNCSTNQESCQLCPEGTFTAGWNNCSVCFQCDICAYGIEEDCSADRNTICKEAPITPKALRVQDTSSSTREEPTSFSPTSSEDLDLISSTPSQNVHSILPAPTTCTESGSDRGIQIDVVYFICVILAVILLLLPGNFLYIRIRMRRRKAPRQREEDIDIVEDGEVNQETLLEHVGNGMGKMEDIHGR